MIAYRFLDVAQRKLDEVLSWYSIEEPGLETEFLRELALILDRARRFPHSGALVKGVGGRTVELRRFLFRRFPYKLIAAVFSDTLVVAALARGTRSPRYWRSRLLIVRR